MHRLMEKRDRLALFIAPLITILTAAVLHMMGRIWICSCGRIRLWGGDVHSAENSQQLADWYSFSHVIHGFLFYFALRWCLPRLHWAWRLTMAVAIECGWEILENSPIIINRYRAATIAVGYTGDTILNSMSDIAMMALGFFVARRLGGMRTLALGVAFEVMTLFVIRDNLTLNVLMLAWPIDAIRQWQAGA